MRSWRVVGTLLALAGALGADVLVLKDGSRVPGRVAEKTSHYEVNTEAGLRTYLKEEVEKVLTGPAELVGDADAVLQASKTEYERIAALPMAEQSAAAKAAVDSLNRAKTSFATAREAFPEERFSDLDVKLTQCMQLLRLLRDRVGSSYARPSSSRMVNGAPPMSPGEAAAVATDGAKRADARQREAAAQAFRQVPADVATAAAVWLSRPEADWKLDAAAQKALQDYLAKGWLSDAGAPHLEAAAWVQAQLAKAPSEPLKLFGLGHLASAPPGAERDALARGYGLVAVQGAWGSAEGHAVKDMDAWIAAGDFELASLAFVKEHRGSETAIVRYVWAYALLRIVQAKQRGWDRPVAALQGIRAPSKPVEEHVAALLKSIRAAANCNTCLGEGRLRCTNCFGRREIRNVCDKCKGSGKVQPPGSAGRLRMGEPVQCYPCRGRGYSLLIQCKECKDGTLDCRQCEAPKPPPDLEEIVKSSPCGVCEGRGHLFRGVAWPCGSCLGLGQRLVPKADPAKVLP